MRVRIDKGLQLRLVFLPFYLFHEWKTTSRRPYPNERNPGVRERSDGGWRQRPGAVAAVEVSGRPGRERLHRVIVRVTDLS